MLLFRGQQDAHPLRAGGPVLPGDKQGCHDLLQLRDAQLDVSRIFLTAAAA